MKNRNQDVPALVCEALEHVRSFYPTVDRVLYDEDLRWRFSDKDGVCPVFDDRIDVGLLEDAADEVSNSEAQLPVEYLYTQPAVQTLEDDDGRFIGSMCDATDEDVARVLAAPVAKRPGSLIGTATRSPWTWVRLANGDLILGTWPHDDLFEELSQSGRTP